jgi:hypothetical protein
VIFKIAGGTGRFRNASGILTFTERRCGRCWPMLLARAHLFRRYGRVLQKRSPERRQKEKDQTDGNRKTHMRAPG